MKPIRLTAHAIAEEYVEVVAICPQQFERRRPKRVIAVHLKDPLRSGVSIAHEYRRSVGQTGADTKIESTPLAVRHLPLNDRERAISGLRIINDDLVINGQATTDARPIINDLGDVRRLVKGGDHNR